jgi:hypothetical protein
MIILHPKWWYTQEIYVGDGLRLALPHQGSFGHGPG